jgi:hypothetical protein
MASSIKHVFQSVIPDDPASAAAGEVLPSHWNGEHDITIDYNDLINLPSLATVATTGAYSDLTGTPTISGTNTGDQNLFSTIAVSGQSDVVADSTADTLTLVAGSNMTITTNAAGDSVTFVANASSIPDVVELPEQGSGPAPIADTVQLYSRDVATRSMPTVIEPVGMPYELQASLFRKKFSLVTYPGAGGVGVTTLGVALTTTATAVARNKASTDLFTSTTRIGETCAAGAGSSGVVRANTLQHWLGNAPGLGGFFFHFRGGPSSAATVADSRCFIGMYGTMAAIGNVDPSSLTDIIGFGSDAGEANLSVMHNDAAGTATKVPLGANFPAQTLSVDMYDMFLFAQPNATEVGYKIINLTTGNEASGTITTDLPSNTTFMAWQMWVNNGTTALAAGIDISHVYTESDS